MKSFTKGKECKPKEQILFSYFKEGVEDHEYSFGHADLGLYVDMPSRTEMWTRDRNLRIKGQNKTKN